MTGRFLIPRELLIAELAVTVFACSRQSPSGPTQVTQTPTFSVTGAVVDTAFRTVIGSPSRGTRRRKCRRIRAD
jgi:hypothetical protein